MIVFAEDENEALLIVDGAIGYIIQHPQKHDVVHPNMKVEEMETANGEQ